MDRHSRGQREFEALMGSPPQEALADVRLRSPQLYDEIVEGAFGGALADAALSRAGREIATIAILAAAGNSGRLLATHAKAALHNGVAASELRALCEQVAVYAGFPRALNALAAVDEVLVDADLPRPPALHRVRLADHETVVTQSGEAGPPVVLLHALALDWRMWEPVMAPLSVGRRVFAYDLRSHGSAAGSPTPFTMADTAADLVGVLDALALDRAHIVGLSYGGAIAQSAAISYPERFASVALLATTDYPFESFESRARAGETDGMKAQIVPSLTRWFTADALALDGWGVRYARECIRRSNAGDWAASWRAFKGLDVQDRLDTLKLPTLVLAGDTDASTTPEIMAGIARRIPGAAYRELRETPHMQTLEKPELVADALGAFITTEPQR